MLLSCSSQPHRPSSRSVKLAGTRTRRHTIGLIPTSQILTCRTASAFTTPSEEGATAAGGFSRRFIPPGYRLPGYPSPGTPKILMLSIVHSIWPIASRLVSLPGQGARDPWAPTICRPQKDAQRAEIIRNINILLEILGHRHGLPPAGTGVATLSPA